MFKSSTEDQNKSLFEGLFQRAAEKKNRNSNNNASSEEKKKKFKFSRVWRALIAEFIGTIIFVFFATGAAVTATTVDPEKDDAAIVIVSLGQAFALVITLYSLAHVSGGLLNPAATFAMMVVRRIGIIRGILYIIAQIGGAIIGSLLLKAVIPHHHEGALGATTVAPGYGVGSAMLLEAIMTFTLIWVIFGTALDPEASNKHAPLAIGLVLVGDLIVGWLYTGSSMNPARSLGPAIVANVWDSHWVYWVGPIAGALVAAILYDLVLMSRPLKKDNKDKEQQQQQQPQASVYQFYTPTAACIPCNCLSCFRCYPNAYWC